MNDQSERVYRSISHIHIAFDPILIFGAHNLQQMRKNSEEILIK